MGRALAVLGTMSSVGKTTVVTGLCRFFADKGIKVAPFKAQNITTNTLTIGNGKVMSVAQFVQARASRVEPSPFLSPILIAPRASGDADVFVLGRRHGSLHFGNLIEDSQEFREIATHALETLLETFELVIVEGSGGAAELNLRDSDIANMYMAKAVNGATVIVGDIERGGVFAQLLGTFWLLEEDERALVKGFIINKFRGDPKLFGDGVNIIERLSGVPVLGVVPYFQTNLPSEDASAEERSPFNWTDEELEKSIVTVTQIIVNSLDVGLLTSLVG